MIGTKQKCTSSYLEQGLVVIQRIKDDLNCCSIGATQACTATVEPIARMWRGRDLEIRTLWKSLGEGEASQKCENKKQIMKGWRFAEHNNNIQAAGNFDFLKRKCVRVYLRDGCVK